MTTMTQAAEPFEALARPGTLIDAVRAGRRRAG